MAWKQSRTTQRLMEQDELSDGKHCVICGRRIWLSGGGYPVCSQPNCHRVYNKRYGEDGE